MGRNRVHRLYKLDGLPVRIRARRRKRISLHRGPPPTAAVELASAYLDHYVSVLLERHRIRGATLVQKQALAAVIHLCGAGAGEEYVGRGFRLLEGQRCGDHEARAYVARVDAMKAVFARLAAEARALPRV